MPIQQRNKLEKLGFDFFPIKKDNYYLVSVWEKSQRTNYIQKVTIGKKKHKDKYVGVFETINVFYNKYC